MCKDLSAALSIALGLLSIVFIVTQTQFQWPSRIAISIGILILSGLNMLLRHRFYSRRLSRLAFHQRHIDRKRDAYGAFSMIMLMLVLALSVMMIGMI